MTAKTRVMLVDDHALCRSGLTELLEHRGDMKVVGATGDPAQVVPMLREHLPDLMVLDLRLATTDGLSLLRMIRAEGCETPVVILTMSDSEDDMSAALRAGVRGYLLKDMEPEEVIDAIARAARGEMVVASAMTLKLAQILQSGPRGSVKGDLVVIARRPLILASLPVSGPFMKHRMLSGDSGSTWGPLSNTYFTPTPRAPMYFNFHSSGIAS